MRIPFDVEFYWHRRFHKTAHGPHWNQLRWWQVRTLRCTVGNAAGHPRRWFYTHFGAFFIDWKWL